MLHRSSLWLRVGCVGELHSLRRTTASVCVIATLGMPALQLAVPGSLAESQAATPARSAGAPRCQGRARHSGPGHVSFSFSCGEQEDVTGFVVQANRALHSVEDPSFAFG